MNSLPILLSDEIRRALREDRAVVALESTLIAHGLPWPENLETALRSESEVRRAGAIPATIAVLGGEITVGVGPSDLETMARATGFLKASRRDLGAVVAQKKDAATTVSATLFAARAVGIRAMATGGLGGVHRGAAESWDVSTDLDELARADGVLLVCAGAKSLLDLPATLEALETRGVPVVGYRTDTLPAFTSRSSGLPLEWRADTPEEAAAIVREHRRLGLPGAVLLAQPVAEEVAIPDDLMNDALATALDQARDEGISGKRITPFLLDAIRRATGGRSLVANKALIVANAGLAAEVAARLASDSTSAPGRA